MKSTYAYFRLALLIFPVSAVLTLSGCGGAGADYAPAPANPAPAPVVLAPTTLAVPAGQSVSGVIDLNGGAQSHIDPLTVVATGGNILSGYTWTLTSGAAQNPLIVFSTKGVVSGRSTLFAQGTYTLYVTVKDDTGSQKDAQVTIDLTQVCDSRPAAFSPCPAAVLTNIHNDYLPHGKVNSAYAATIITGGGTPPYSKYGVASGALPPGIGIDPSNGVLLGTPTAAGTYNFYVQVSDAAGDTTNEVGVLAARFTLVVDP